MIHPDEYDRPVEPKPEHGLMWHFRTWLADKLLPKVPQ